MTQVKRERYVGFSIRIWRSCSTSLALSFPMCKIRQEQMTSKFLFNSQLAIPASVDTYPVPMAGKHSPSACPRYILRHVKIIPGIYIELLHYRTENIPARQVLKVIPPFSIQRDFRPRGQPACQKSAWKLARESRFPDPRWHCSCLCSDTAGPSLPCNWRK